MTLHDSFLKLHNTVAESLRLTPKEHGLASPSPLYGLMDQNIIYRWPLQETLHIAHSTSLHSPPILQILRQQETHTMASRVGLRFGQAFRQNFASQIRFNARRRMQSTAADTTAEAQANQSAIAKFYNSPVGPKTVHFWAPIMKVCNITPSDLRQHYDHTDTAYSGVSS